MKMSPTPAGLARFLNYPMGPKLRAYLNISEEDYGGASVPTRSDDEAAAFTEFLISTYDTHEPPQDEALVDLLDELVSMDLPEAVLDLAARQPQTLFAQDFRAQLAIGVAAMLTSDLTTAEEHLRHAQSLLPSEPAPYVNLAQIYLSQGRLDEAETWCVAGLDADANHFSMWDLFAELLRERHGEYMPETLLAHAEKRCSWAGLSLAANLISTGDRYLKATLLERLYHQGERDAQFLVELTGAYGIASEFAKIPPLVWQAERTVSKGLPWQLHIHCAQAHISLNEAEQALAQIAKALHSPDVPEEAQPAIHELQDEARALLAEGGGATLH